MTAKFSKFAVVAMVAVLAASSFAKAASVNQLLYDIAVADGILSQEKTYLFNDADHAAISVDAPTVAELSVGDVIVGTFDFNSISHLAGSSRLLGANSGGANDALFGRYSIMVTGISGSTLSFGPSGAFGANGMFEVYTAATNTVNDSTPDAGFGDAAFASADLYAVLGFDAVLPSAYDFGVTGSVADLKFATLAAAALDGVTIANTTNVKLYVIDDGLSDGGDGLGNLNVIGNIGSFISGNDFEGSGSIIGTGGPSFDSTTAFQARLTIVPLPAAVWSGLVLLGAMGIRRIRRVA